MVHPTSKATACLCPYWAVYYTLQQVSYSEIVFSGGMDIPNPHFSILWIICHLKIQYTDLPYWGTSYAWYFYIKLGSPGQRSLVFSSNQILLPSPSGVPDLYEWKGEMVAISITLFNHFMFSAFSGEHVAIRLTTPAYCAYGGQQSTTSTATIIWPLFFRL